MNASGNMITIIASQSHLSSSYHLEDRGSTTELLFHIMQDTKSTNWVAYCQSSIVHLLFLVPMGYILVLCIQNGFSSKTLHTVLSTVGCGSLIAEAILVVSGEALLVAKVSTMNRIRIHWILNVMGMALVLAGYGVLAADGSNGDTPHQVKGHGKIGRIGITVGLLVCLTAIPAVQTRLLPGKVSHLCVKLFHIFIGTICFILFIAGLISGLFESWWSDGKLGRDLCYAAYVSGAFFILIKPLYSWGSRIYGISKNTIKPI